MTSDGALDALDQPAIVVRGDASADEVAALVAVLQTVAAAAAAAQEPVHRVRPQWSSPGRAVRRPHVPGPGAWRASALPR